MIVGIIVDSGGMMFAFVHLVLEHLAARDFQGAPKYLGVDGSGRDILSYIDGKVPVDLAFHDDATQRAAAAMIRRFHDIAAESLPTLAGRAADVDAICHNDLAPCNFVFRDGVPVAIIDFDAAAPGARVLDLV